MSTTGVLHLLSPGPSSFPVLRRRLAKPRPFISSPRKHRPFSSAAFNSRDEGRDFVSRVIEDNPSQVEPRFLVGDRLLKLRERTSRTTPARWDRYGADGEAGKEGAKPVYLKDILREFKGQLYVPGEVFRARLSEEKEFDRNMDVLPKLSLKEFLKYLRADKVKLLTFKSPAGGAAWYRDFVVDLKEIPGIKGLHQTKWAIRLSGNRLWEVLEEYSGPQYEIEKHAPYVGKVLERPNPVASSISSRIMAELGVVTAVIAVAAGLVGGFIASAVFVVTSSLYAFCIYVVWPSAKPFAKLLLGIVFKIAQRACDNIDNIFGYGGTLSRMKEFYTYGGLSDSVKALKPILFVSITMVLLIRFTLSRRPKNFRKWDIWQGIEFSQSKPQARVDGSTGVFFSDVAGIDEAVEELQELVEYLKNPKLFDERKIKPPHGVLLEGPPGCGKTLVAKAIAGEAGVPFYQMAGSEFIEVLVGVGSARIRDLFMRAKVNRPSVVFIDEIDALGTRRQEKFNENDDEYNAATHERETTLNQLLIELDGFDTGKGVIFLGATNRMDLLDPALLRPGRFDRKIRVLPPGTKGRLDILKVHASKVKVFPTVDLSSYAQNLTGWTGAQLAQLLQEAALVAVRNVHSSILQSDLDDAVDRLTIGPKHVGIELSHKGQRRRATAEVGTAITSHLLRRYDDAKVEFCERISINPRGQTFSQIVFRRLDDEAYTYERRPQLLHRLQVLLGGRAAEELIYGQDTSKASLEYLSDASWLARKILSIWNLENSMTIHGEPCPWTKPDRFVGPRIDFERSLYDDYGLFEPPINLDFDVQVARRTEKLMSEMYGKTVSLLRRHQAALVKTIKVLLDRKEINRDHIEYILHQYPVDTPVTLVFEEKNPGSLPFFEVEGEQRELLLSQATGKELSQLS